MINKIKSIKLKNTYLLVLFLGVVSTIASGIWALMLDYTVKSENIIGARMYASSLLSEIAFSALFHIAVGIILLLDERKKVE